MAAAAAEGVEKMYIVKHFQILQTESQKDHQSHQITDRMKDKTLTGVTHGK